MRLKAVVSVVCAAIAATQGPHWCDGGVSFGRDRQWNPGRNKKKALTLDYTPGCSFTTGAHAMQIGIVAKKVGLSVDAIRFYERNALMPRPARTQGGFRQYGERDIETLTFI